MTEINKSETLFNKNEQKVVGVFRMFWYGSLKKVPSLTFVKSVSEEKKEVREYVYSWFFLKINISSACNGIYSKGKFG